MDTREAQGLPLEPNPPVETEQEKVEGWRLHVPLEAGYPTTVAEQLAARTDVDLHRAVEFVQAGCGHDLAARILL